VLVNPGISISTSEAYSGCIPYESSQGIAGQYEKEINGWKNTIVNDFEKTVFELHPEVGQLKDELCKAGAVYCSMSGSGSTVYGIFRSKPVIPDDIRRMVIYSGIF